ncbi:MAG: DEAD/DEAH box helicase family protein, partial [Flavobacteriaceae bacterium]|nr:DEAD/DEAH box helicase family protein [Flavobacteriaceae bacterium]
MQASANSNTLETKLFPLPAVTPTNRTVVHASKDKLILGKHTTAAARLYLQTLRDIEAAFQRRGHVPNSDQWSSLEEVLKCLVAMANGDAQPVVHLSSLDPGVGKTTTYIHFIRNLVHLPQYSEVGILICLPRLDEVKRVVAELDLDPRKLCVKTSKDELNAKSEVTASEAQVLITTHEQVRRLSSSQLHFKDVRGLHFRGQPREVRIWDEAFDPRKVKSVTSDDIKVLVSLLRSACPTLASRLEEFNERLMVAPSDQLEVDYLFADFSYSGIEDAKAVLRSRPDDAEKLQCLMDLAKGKARKATGNSAFKTLFAWKQVVPADFAPLVFDASGRVRMIYDAMEQNGELVRLDASPKDYSTVKVCVYKIASSKHAWRTNRSELLALVANIMSRSSSSRFLIIAHKDVGAQNREQDLRSIAPGAEFDILTWGAHQGTNAYADSDHIIVANTFFLPEEVYEAQAYAALGLEVSQKLPNDTLKEFKQGELSDMILQGTCRGALRGCKNGKATPAEVHILASPKTNMPHLVRRIFPNCKLTVKQVRKPRVSSTVKRAVDYCKERLALCSDVIWINDLMEACGVSNRSNFNKQVRDHPAFEAYVKEAG